MSGALQRMRRSRWVAVARHVHGWFPLTTSGVVALAVLWVLHTGLAVEQSDRVVQALTVLAFAIIALCVAVVLAAGVSMALVRPPPEGDPLELVAGAAFRTGYAAGPWSWLPILSIELVWESPRGVASALVRCAGRYEEEVVPGRRGRTLEIVRRIHVGDVFGMSAVSFRRHEPRHVTILPAMTAGTELAPLLQLRSGDGVPVPTGRPEGDRIEFRPYAPGDPLRLVLWKLYARSGQLFVRTPELTLTPHERTLVYFVAGEGDEASAGVARTALERNELGADFVFQADGERTATRDPQEAVMQLVRSADAATPAEGLGELLAAEDGPGGARCILFVPNRPGRWLEAVAERIAGRSAEIRAVVGTDERVAATEVTLARWLLFGGARVGRRRQTDLEVVVSRLSRMGADVRVVDRTSGHLVSPDVIATRELRHAAAI